MPPICVYFFRHECILAVDSVANSCANSSTSAMCGFVYEFKNCARSGRLYRVGSSLLLPFQDCSPSMCAATPSRGRTRPEESFGLGSGP